MTKRDIILIMTLVIIALISFAGLHYWSNGQGSIAAEISADGQPVHYVALQNLQEQKEFTVQGPLGDTIVQVREGEARIIDSPCPDKICVRAGWIKLAGQSAICVPNRIILRIVAKDNKIDSISR
ncbi:MAG: NusG domain II-containing protein [Dehalobacterium sp.]